MHRPMVWLMRGLLGIIVILIWEWISGNWIEAWLISSPLRIAEQLWAVVVSGEIWPHVIATVAAVAVGFPIGVIFGIMLGYLMGRYRLLADLLGPYLMGLYGIPKVGFAPLFIIWFGIGVGSKVALVVVISFFFNFFSTYAGMRFMNEDIIRYAQLLGSKGSRTTLKVILPAISPYIMTGIRSSVPLAVIGVVTGEFIAASAGLGLYMRQAVSLLDMTGTFVGMIFLFFLVVILNDLAERLERRVLKWMPEHDAEVQPG